MSRVLAPPARAARHRSSCVPVWPNYLLLASSFAVAFAVAEAAVQFAGIAVPSWLRDDPVVGWSYVPNARYLKREEGYSAGRLNSHGLRDVEHSYDKPPGVFRILILGDSFTEALQVPLEQSYARRLESLLNAAPGRPGAEPPQAVSGSLATQSLGPSARRPTVEVIALARSGMGTAQQRRWFQTEGRRYQPDLVLLQTCVNDPVDNVPTIRGRERVPYYVRRADELVLDESFQDAATNPMRRAAAAVRRCSAVAELAYQAFRRQRSRGQLAEFQVGPDDGRPLPLGAFENHYRSEPPQEWATALDATEQVLAALRDDVQAAGARLVVFGATDGLELEAHGRLIAARHDLDLNRREAWWQASCRRSGVAFVPLLESFRARRGRSESSPHGFGPTQGRGHWNELGHRWAAEILAQSLEAEIRPTLQGDAES